MYLIQLAQANPTVGGKPVPQRKTEQVQPSGSTAAEPEQAPPSGSSYMQLLFPLILILVLYFLMIRPQQKKEKQKKEMIKKIKKGDKVITRGGIWGVITGIKDEICVIKIAEKVNIEVSISAIEIVNPNSNPPKKT